MSLRLSLRSAACLRGRGAIYAHIVASSFRDKMENLAEVQGIGGVIDLTGFERRYLIDRASHVPAEDL